MIRNSLLAIRNSLFSILLLTACSPPGSNGVPTFVPPPTAGPPPGSTYTVARGDIAETIEMRGRVAAEQEAYLMFPVGGTLKAIHVSPGDRVSEGALLAELDAPGAEQELVKTQFDLELALAQLQVAELQLELADAPQPGGNADLLAAQIALAQAESELQHAQVEYDEALQRPWDPPEAAEAYSWALQLKEWNYELAQARLAQVQQAQQQARAAQRGARAVQELQVEMAQTRVERERWLKVVASEQISNTQLMAPLSGVVVSIEKRAGDQVGPYETIGVVADPSELWVVATALEADVDSVAIGQAATMRLDAYPDQVYSGTVLQITSQTITWQGQDAYEVTIAFDKGQDVPSIMRMGADVVIAGRMRRNVLLVPTQVLLTIGGREYVEVTTADGEIERVEVQTGISNDAETEIVAGLQAGQVILIP